MKSFTDVYGVFGPL